MSNGKSFLQIFIAIGFCLILTGLFIASYSKSAKAEIATAKDWLGLFNTTTTGNAKADTVNGTSWGYPSNRNATTGVCAQTPGANPVLTSAGCSNLVPSPLPSSGFYEFRMYANDQETADALIAKSNTISPSASSTPGPAVNCPTQTAYPRVQNGLITASSISDNFSNSNANCVLGSPAPFASFKIPTYDDLKSLYFTQSKVPKPSPNPNPNTTLGAVTDGNIYNYTNGVSTGAYNYTDTAVIFINGSLSINGNITGTTDKGLVLVVGGDVNIASGVTQIDAVLISQGTIYTAGAECSLPPPATPGTDSQLIVNGSLISLESTQPIKFCRKLSSSTSPAEIITNQPKYLVILRNILSDTYQKWSEIQ